MAGPSIQLSVLWKIELKGWSPCQPIGWSAGENRQWKDSWVRVASARETRIAFAYFCCKGGLIQIKEEISVLSAKALFSVKSRSKSDEGGFLKPQTGGCSSKVMYFGIVYTLLSVWRSPKLKDSNFLFANTKARNLCGKNYLHCRPEQVLFIIFTKYPKVPFFGVDKVPQYFLAELIYHKMFSD